MRPAVLTVARARWAGSTACGQCGFEACCLCHRYWDLSNICLCHNTGSAAKRIQQALVYSGDEAPLAKRVATIPPRLLPLL